MYKQDIEELRDLLEEFMEEEDSTEAQRISTVLEAMDDACDSEQNPENPEGDWNGMYRTADKESAGYDTNHNRLNDIRKAIKTKGPDVPQNS